MIAHQNTFCSYYQAHVVKEKCWFMAATLRSFEHIAFDRTLDPKKSIFEFFVPQGLEGSFLEIMAYYQQIGLITNLSKLPNRLSSLQSTSNLPL
jgi:hypothetical protein